jgi:hypothetical protein
MITRQQAVGTGTPTSPEPKGPPAGGAADTEGPAWLWESLRYGFWEPADLAQSMRCAGLEPGRRAVAAWWWSLLAAADQLGPRMYAAAFVRATERHDSDQVRWSLLAMLRDEVQHEQLFGLALRSLAGGGPKGLASRRAPGQAERHPREAHQQAERYWTTYRAALDQDGLAVVTGGLLLDALVTGDLYGSCATNCTIPALATAFRHLGQDAKRHQGALRALVSRDWPGLPPPQRAAVANQVQAAAGFLGGVLIDPEGDLAIGPAVACGEGLGVPSADQRLEAVRAALLKLKDLQLRYGVPFPAVPALAIPEATQQVSMDNHKGEHRHARC